MYEYARKRHIASAISTGLGADRYVPPNPRSQVAPWAKAYTTVQNITVTCYHNAPREEVLRKQVPYTMEISVPGNNFICISNPDQTCPESVHQGTDIKDPWRQRQCAAWKQDWEQQAANIIASEGFRNQVTENILDLAGISGWRRWFTKPAEFLQVLDEKERRERAIKIMALLTFAAGGGTILWTYLRNKKGERLEPNAPWDEVWNELRDELYVERGSEKTGAKKLAPRRKVSLGPGRLPDSAPNIARQLYDRMVYSAKRFGGGKILREARPTWKHDYQRRSGSGWHSGWRIGTDAGDGNINSSPGYFWVDKHEEVHYRDAEQVYGHGSRGRGIQLRYPVSYEKALFMASNFYQDRAKLGAI
jgi:hypothetical protein